MEKITKKEIKENMRSKAFRMPAYLQTKYNHSYECKINGVDHRFETDCINEIMLLIINSDSMHYPETKQIGIDYINKREFIDTVYEYLNS